MTIGWIGTGNMGLRMAKRLIGAGYELCVYNRTAEKARPLIDTGRAVLLSSPAEIAKNCNVIFTSVTNDAALEEILSGPGGMLPAMHPNTDSQPVLIDMSTINPDYSAGMRCRVEEKGWDFVAAPVIGSMFMVEAGLLKILASGSRATVSRLEPLFSAIGRQTVYLGNGVQARYMKIAVNMVICSYLTIFGEILLAGEGAGFEWSELNDFLEDCPGASPMLKDKGTTIRERIWASPAALTSTALKDLGLAVSIARKAGLSLPLTNMARQYDCFMHFNKKYDTYSTFGTVGVLEDICGVSPYDIRKCISGDEAAQGKSALSDALVCVTTLLAREALDFCKASGVDADAARECLGTCHGASTYFKNQCSGAAQEELSVKRAVESLDAVLEIARANGLFLPLITTAASILAGMENL